MKKQFIIAATLLATFQVHAENLPSTNENLQIPAQYLEIDKNCQNSDIFQYNACLKNALFKIMDDNLTEEQIQDLKKQLNNIEQEVDIAEFDYENPQAKAAEGDENKIKELRGESMNLIWKRILVETINSLNALGSEYSA